MSKKTWYIYAHFTKDTNELFYIGVGTGNRINQSGNRNKLWKNIVSKHGYDSFIILDGFIDRDEAVKEEVRLQEINKPRACLQYGDRLNSVVSDSTILKLKSIKRKKGKDSHMYGRKGENHNMYGKKHTEESKRKMSKSSKGIRCSKKCIEASSKKVVDCRGNIYNSLTEAAKAVGLSNPSSISRQIKGDRKTAGKYMDGTPVSWGYYE